jgi:hypothetical protein
MWVMMIIPVAPAARIHVRSCTVLEELLCVFFSAQIIFNCFFSSLGWAAKRVSNFPSDDNDNNTTTSGDQHRSLSE